VPLPKHQVSNLCFAEFATVHGLTGHADPGRKPHRLTAVAARGCSGQRHWEARFLRLRTDSVPKAQQQPSTPQNGGLRNKATRTARLQFTPRDCGQLSSDPASRDQLFDIAPGSADSLIKSIPETHGSKRARP